MRGRSTLLVLGLLSCPYLPSGCGPAEMDLEEGGEPIRLTRSPALDDAADVSPDGGRLAFVSTREGNAEVFVMPFAPHESGAEDRAQNVTDSPADDFHPALSPDGTRIAWARRATWLRGPGRMMTEVRVMSVAGSGSRLLAGGGEMIAGAPEWSGDGELHAHGIFYGGAMERLRRRCETGWTSRIWRVPLAGGEPVPITEPDTLLALSPSVTAEGRVAYVRGRRPPSGEAPHCRRTGAVHLTPASDADDAFPAWSPDCRTIIFRSGRDGDTEIYRMDADGSDVRRLTHREGVETVPDVSPDGEWVAFVSDRGGMSDEFLLTDDPQAYGDIRAVPVEGGEAVRLTDDKWEDGLRRWGSLPER